MKKAIQICSCYHSGADKIMVQALCDDGFIWVSESKEWIQLNDTPQNADYEFMNKKIKDMTPEEFNEAIRITNGRGLGE